MAPGKLIIYILAGSILLTPACGQQEGKNKKIVIATSANMQFAIQRLSKQFTKKTGTVCELVIGSSGKLTAQIKEGAPYDVFVAANMMYPEELYNSGLAGSTPKVYAYGKLVLWSMVEGIKPSIDRLSDEAIGHIALANPKIAPYGVAAMEVLEYYGLSRKIEEKLVYGESIAQTNQFIVSKSAELGFTAMSVVLSPQMKGQGQWIELDSSIYTPIAQGVVIIKRQNTDSGHAQGFNEFLFSDEAKKVLKEFGYAIDWPASD